MKKEAMFFEDQVACKDGMFFKQAQENSPFKLPKPGKPEVPVHPTKPQPGMTTSDEARKGSELPVNLPKPQMGHGMLGVPSGKCVEKKAEDKKSLSDQALNTAKSVGEGAWNAAKSVGSRLGTTAESVGKGAWNTASGAIKDAPVYAEKGLKKIEESPDWAKALMVGIPGLLLARKLGRGAKNLLKGPPPKPVGIGARFGNAWRALAGKE